MDLRQLEFVVAIAEESNFTRAAARCHIVQSGLSFQVARLEKELGVRLFERTSRTVRLAPAGEVLLPYARRALDEVAAARAQIAALSGEVRGRLRLGVIPGSHGSIDLPDVLQTYHRRYPDVDVVVSDVGSLAMVSLIQQDELDAAFVGLFPGQLPAGLSARLLRVEPLVAIVDDGHPGARRTRVDLADLAATSSFIDCHSDSGLRTQVDLAFVRARATRHVSFELGNLLDVARMASLGLGAAVVPASVAAALPSGPARRFAVRPLDDPQALQPLSLVSGPPSTASHAARVFVDLFAAEPMIADS